MSKFNDPLVIAGVEYRSRLLTGTGKYQDLEQTRLATEAAGAEIVTVAIRRTNIGQDPNQPNLLDAVPPSKYTYLPNTAGCYNAQDAVRTLRLARELLDGHRDDLAATRAHLAARQVDVAVDLGPDMFATRPAQRAGLAFQWSARGVPHGPRDAASPRTAALGAGVPAGQLAVWDKTRTGAIVGARTPQPETESGQPGTQQKTSTV